MRWLAARFSTVPADVALPCMLEMLTVLPQEADSHKIALRPERRRRFEEELKAAVSDALDVLARWVGGVWMQQQQLWRWWCDGSSGGGVGGSGSSSSSNASLSKHCGGQGQALILLLPSCCWCRDEQHVMQLSALLLFCSNRTLMAFMPVCQPCSSTACV